MDNGTNENERLVTTVELALLMRCHKQTVLRLWRARVIPGYRIGTRDLRFRPSAVLEALGRRPGW